MGGSGMLPEFTVSVKRLLLSGGALQRDLLHSIEWPHDSEEISQHSQILGLDFEIFPAFPSLSAISYFKLCSLICIFLVL